MTHMSSVLNLALLLRQHNKMSGSNRLYVIENNALLIFIQDSHSCALPLNDQIKGGLNTIGLCNLGYFL
jgi:hypothetical protein